MSGQRLLRACAGTVICAVLGLLAGAGTAFAHATLISPDPRQGAVIGTTPATVSLTFGEPVVVAADGVRIFDPDGAQVDDGHTGHLGRSSTVGVNLRNSAQQGTYTVSWRVISADSHPVVGAFTFSVGHPSRGRAPPSAQPTGSAGVGVLYAIVRAVAFMSYALLAGSIGFVLLCWSGAIARRDVCRVMVVGWAGLLATTVATLLLQGPYGNGLGFGRLFDSVIIMETLDSRLGAALTARLMLLALVGGYVVLLCPWLQHVGRGGQAWCGAVGMALALALASTWAAADHAAVGLQSALALPVDVVHLLTMGLWGGGLVTLVVVLRPRGRPELAAPAGAVYRFSGVATGAIVILIGTGSYQSWRQLGSWAAFGSTGYGRLLLVKLGAFALMLAAAFLSQRWVIRQRRTLIGVGAAAQPSPSTLGRSIPGQRGLRRSVLGEAALGALILGVTALLVNAEPGRTATAPPLGRTHHVISYEGGQGQIVVDVDPAATGPNTIRIFTEDPHGSPHDVAELRSTLMLPARQLGPFTIPLERNGLGEYVANGVQLPYNGAWQLSMTVRTSDIDETTVVTPINVR